MHALSELVYIHTEGGGTGDACDLGPGGLTNEKCQFASSLPDEFESGVPGHEEGLFRNGKADPWILRDIYLVIGILVPEGIWWLLLFTGIPGGSNSLFFFACDPIGISDPFLIIQGFRGHVCDSHPPGSLIINAGRRLLVGSFSWGVNYIPDLGGSHLSELPVVHLHVEVLAPFLASCRERKSPFHVCVNVRISFVNSEIVIDRFYTHGFGTEELLLLQGQPRDHSDHLSAHAL